MCLHVFLVMFSLSCLLASESVEKEASCSRCAGIYPAMSRIVAPSFQPASVAPREIVHPFVRRGCTCLLRRCPEVSPKKTPE